MGSCRPPPHLGYAPLHTHLISCAQSWRVGCSGSACRDRLMLPCQETLFLGKDGDAKGGGRGPGTACPDGSGEGGASCWIQMCPVSTSIPSPWLPGGISQSNAWKGNLWRVWLLARTPAWGRGQPFHG